MGTKLREILKPLGAHIRSLGFKGSRQHYRREEDDFIFVINIQGSRSGEVFYVNLGAQPVFIPAECDSALSTLKEYECIMRRRVGKEWPWTLDDEGLLALVQEIDVEQAKFFGLARTLRSAIATDSADELLQKFRPCIPVKRATLHLARAAVALGHTATASALVEYGLSIAQESATGLISDLKLVRQAIAPLPDD